MAARWRISRGTKANAAKLAKLANELPLSDAEFERLERQMPDGSEVWFERETDGWVVAARIMRQGGRPAIAELRLFPAEPLRPWPGRWSENPADVPAGGINSETWRLVQVGALRAGIERRAAELPTESTTPGADENLLDDLRADAARHPGVAGRPDTFYAKLALAYASEVEAGNPHPLQTLAPRLGKSPAVLQNMLRDARQRGLLTEPKGRRPGRLTARARRLLENEGRDDG